MSSLASRIERIWWQQQAPPLALRLAEPLYGFISNLHLKRRAANRVAAALPLISVGNITAGGSGKTPFVIWLAGQLQEHGYRPVILCRGDGGTSRSPLFVTAETDPSLAGDEAVLLARTSGCPVVAARDRIAGSCLAAGHGDIIILDDGFQYRQLERSCDIVLVPAEGVGNGHLIPAGPLREPIAALGRADLVVRSGVGDSQAITAVREWRWAARPGEIRDVMQTGAERPVRMVAVAAIARPERFFDDLQSLGVMLSGRRAYADHHCYRDKEVAELAALDTPVVVTAKDAVKLAPLWPSGQPLWMLEQQGEGEPGLFEAILARVTPAPA